MQDIDDLTGLLTRAAFMRRLEGAIAAGLLGGYPLCLLLLDLDYLKAINDHYGHLAGDAALTAVAVIMRAILRGDDVGGRYGGDEFVVLLPGTPLDGGLAVAERIRESVAAATFTAP